ncbi:UDP-glucose 4-epimerase GalE [Paenibacillus sp. TRM 82003]|uniref:UDP-glucose 4-epimerase GalE n=1 Tax=Kineococcus sp. TRM81007 TaxID=2925831 RepID=UPI001F578185|nr:UDP-glucose 4-epimerase GalE [Kineococcus sp. TRM81007]MCI2237849.1 UDP-glucose 4-epimerase GalE [Kineococcus sp. TRM81007]MCI3924580.1 UDP-glucose 4-epimerase GalE [Paenibacillus sp. TRM 82003]
MSVLVTGGAGFIGSHVVRLLQQRGDDVVVVDDLSNGRAERVGDSPLVRVDLAAEGAQEVLRAAFTEHSVDAVVHFAARKQVGESVERPARYWQQNVGGQANLLQAMQDAGVGRLVFSSSAATYGAPQVDVVREDGPAEPINPYGQTKLVGEWMNRAAGVAWGLRSANLRYFNVAGAGWPDLGDSVVMNLVPIVFTALDAGRAPVVFGDDYPTPDGSCVRDYVHVLDLAEAHLAALDHLAGDAAGEAHDVFNVGTGTGASVFEVLRVVREVTGIDVEPEVRERRAGDPPQLVADVTRIREELGWTASKDLRDIVSSAWEAWRAVR